MKSNINGSKVVITGGSGYIGARLSMYLAKNNFQVIPVCRSRGNINENWMTLMQSVIFGDIRDEGTLDKVRKCLPDIIIHLISLDHVKSENNISDTLDVNVQSTWQLLKLAKELSVKDFINFSSVQVYGNSKNKILTESSTLNPNNFYALTHKMSEDLVLYYNNIFGLNSYNIRLSNSYGDPLFENSNSWSLVINDLCKKVFYEKKIILKSRGESLKDFIHYTTICNAIHQLIKSGKAKEPIYNLSSGNSLSILNLAVLIKKIYKERNGLDVPVFINESKLFKIKNDNHLKYHRQFSNDKIRSVIEFDKLDLVLGINRIFESLERKL
tara:strand:+ start:4054 stop:5034 length:981 start_codon:yes stop_codon:yes gene_type:complete